MAGAPPVVPPSLCWPRSGCLSRFSLRGLQRPTPWLGLDRERLGVDALARGAECLGSGGAGEHESRRQQHRDLAVAARDVGDRAGAGVTRRSESSSGTYSSGTPIAACHCRAHRRETTPSLGEIDALQLAAGRPSKVASNRIVLWWGAHIYFASSSPHVLRGCGAPRRR